MYLVMIEGLFQSVLHKNIVSKIALWRIQMSSYIFIEKIWNLISELSFIIIMTLLIFSG